MPPLCTCVYLGPGQTVRIDSPDCPIHRESKIEIDALNLASLLHSAGDSLQAAHAGGLATVLVRRDMTLCDFMRFCLGEAGRMEGSKNESAQ